MYLRGASNIEWGRRMFWRGVSDIEWCAGCAERDASDNEWGAHSPVVFDGAPDTF